MSDIFSIKCACLVFWRKFTWQCHCVHVHIQLLTSGIKVGSNSIDCRCREHIRCRWTRKLTRSLRPSVSASLFWLTPTTAEPCLDSKTFVTYPEDEVAVFAMSKSQQHSPGILAPRQPRKNRLSINPLVLVITTTPRIQKEGSQADRQSGGEERGKGEVCKGGKGLEIRVWKVEISCT